jgi:hypothetical protein
MKNILSPQIRAFSPQMDSIPVRKDGECLVLGYDFISLVVVFVAITLSVRRKSLLKGSFIDVLFGNS